MSLELKGTIKKIGDIQTFASGFQKREFVLLTEETYAQEIPFELLQDKVDIIEPFKEGDKALVGFNCVSRKWTSPQGEDKLFLWLKAWKIITPPVNLTSSGKVPTASPEEAFPKEEKDGLDW